MRISRERLRDLAGMTGFREDVLEKAVQLLNLLNSITGHPYLANRLVLKGGTALNLFLLELPRLSVDIDLNYIGSPTKEIMLEERPQVESSIEAVVSREGMGILRRPNQYAGGKWLIQFQGASGGAQSLELDLNYMYRTPLWQPGRHDSYSLGPYKASGVRLVDAHELIAGKLAALLSRHASRDLFDVHQLLTSYQWDIGKLRLGFVLFGGMNPRDWRSVSVDDIEFSLQELNKTLIPVMGATTLGDDKEVSVWASKLRNETRQAMRMLLPLSRSEREFLDRLLDRGEVRPELLTSDEEMKERIAHHPLLEWKAQNARNQRLRQ